MAFVWLRLDKKFFGWLNLISVTVAFLLFLDPAGQSSTFTEHNWNWNSLWCIATSKQICIKFQLVSFESQNDFKRLDDLHFSVQIPLVGILCIAKKLCAALNEVIALV